MPDLYDPSSFNFGMTPNPVSFTGMSGISPATLAALSGYNPNSSDPFGLGVNSGSSAPTGGAGSGLGSWFQGASPFQWGQLGLSGLGSIGSLIAGFGSLGVANKQLNLSTQMANANLANQTQAYNTNLADRAAVRGAWEGLNPQQVNQYVTANSLKSFKVGG